MQAHYETETEISASHQLIIQLPDSIPAGKAKVAITYEIPGETPETEANKTTLMNAFLDSLPDNPTGGLSREEIQTSLAQERQAWDD